MSDVDLKMLFELLKEVREDQKTHGMELAKQSAILDNLDNDVKDLKKTVARNTEDIAHHIRRTDGLQDLYDSNRTRITDVETRVGKLEEPVKAKAWIKSNLVSVISICTAIGSFIAFLYEKFNK